MRDLTEYEVLDRVATRLSLEAAAKDLGLSPSTVSRKLAALERRLGIALVHRTTRSASLTPAGQAFAAYCRQMCEAADKAEAIMSTHRQSFSGILRVNAPTLLGRVVLAPVLFAFGQRHPGVVIQLSLANEFVDPVSEGIDIVFRTGQLKDSGLRARLLAQAHLVIVASPVCLARCGTPASLADVAQQPCLVQNHAEGRWRCGSADGLIVKVAFAANDLELIRDAAIAGLGFALLPRFMVWPALEKGQLTAVEVDSKLGATPVYAVFPGHDIPNPCARALADAVAENLSASLAWKV